MHLVADIGNTEMVLGLLDPQGEIKAHWRLSTGISRTRDEYDHLIHALLARKGVEGSQITRAVVGSVVPSVTDRIRKALEGFISGPVFTVCSGADLPIQLKVEEPQTVGADRIVNTLAAKEIFHRDTIVVDLGTATTYDCITAAGDFIGGRLSSRGWSFARRRR